MKEFKGKTKEEAIELAAKEFNVTKEEVLYYIESELKDEQAGMPVVIDAFVINEVVEFINEFITNLFRNMGLEVTINCEIKSRNALNVTLNSERNGILIGSNGKTLKAINEILVASVCNRFRRKIYILVNVGTYKDNKYEKIVHLAHKICKIVIRDHYDVKLDPMTNDERKVIHEALKDYRDIKTESIGEGDKRAVVIKYVGGDEHAFQTNELYYKDILFGGHGKHAHNNRFNKGFKKPARKQKTLDDYLHNTEDNEFLKKDINNEAAPVEQAEENKVNAVDNTIDDLPSASIVSPIVNNVTEDDNKEVKEENNENK